MSADPHQTTPEHERLRLSPEDVSLLWAVVEGFQDRCGKRSQWPRLERILFDLELMMAKQQAREDADGKR